jgi:Arm domain-containing DNA-binding protein
MPKLTKRRVDAAEAQASEYFLWDQEVPGFGLRVLPSGRKSYVVQYRAGRRPRRMSLGPSTVLTCEQARDRAITIVAAVRNGQDGELPSQMVPDGPDCGLGQPTG